MIVDEIDTALVLVAVMAVEVSFKIKYLAFCFKSTTYTIYTYSFPDASNNVQTLQNL